MLYIFILLSRHTIVLTQRKNSKLSNELKLIRKNKLRNQGKCSGPNGKETSFLKEAVTVH